MVTRIKPVQDPRPKAARKQTVEVESVVLVHVRMINFCVQIWFGVVPDWRSPVPTFEDRFVKVLFFRERKIVPDSCHVVATLSPFKTVGTVIQDVAIVADKADHDKLFRAYPPTRIPANSQARVLVSAKGSGFIYVFSDEQVTNKHM